MFRKSRFHLSPERDCVWYILCPTGFISNFVGLSSLLYSDGAGKFLDIHAPLVANLWLTPRGLILSYIYSIMYQYQMYC